MSKPRIIGGSARGRPLETPPSGTRPSPARLREALFDLLAFEGTSATASTSTDATAGVEDAATGARSFLDLYSGSGAVGLEAASRGWRATCVELSPRAAAVIRRNAAQLRLAVTVVEDDALAYARRSVGEYDVVFAAPPYPDDLGTIFAGVLSSGAAKAGGLYVLQHPTGFAVPSLFEGGDRNDLGPARVKRYGSNSLTLVRVPSAPTLAPDAGSL